MTAVLLSGASGFLGSHALRHLLANTSWQIVCPVSFSHRGVPERITLAVPDDQWHRVTVVRADLACPVADTTATAIGDIDLIVNYASQSHVDRSIADPAPFVTNNVSLMVNLLEYARQAKPKAFLHISTDEVYGPAPEGTRHKEWDPIIPSNPYSASKACQEALATSYWRTYQLPVVIVNSMNLIGETQDPEKYLPTVLRCLADGQKVPVHASAGRVGSRHYLHARNLADAVLFLLRRGTVSAYAAGASRPDRWHCAGPNEIDNLELARMVADAAGLPFRYELVDSHALRPGHDLRYALDSSKLAGAGWSAPVDFPDALERTVKWTLERPEWLHRQTLTS